MKPRISPQASAAVALGLVLALLGTAWFVAYESYLNAQSSRHWVIHTYEVLGALDTISSTVKEAEVSTRTFLVTGSRADLDQFDKAKQVLPVEFVRIFKLTADNTVQAARITRLEKLIGTEMASLDRLLALDSSGEGIRSSGNALGSHENYEAIKKQVAVIAQVERDLLAQRNAKLYKTVESTVFLMTTFSVLSAGIILVLFMFAVRSLNERQEALAQATNNERRAGQANTRLLAILGGIGDGVYEIDKTGNLTYINSSGQELLGFHQEEMVGRNAHELFHGNADGTDASLESCEIFQVLQDGKIRHRDHDTFFDKNRQPVAVRWVCAPLMIDQTQAGAVVCFTDISARIEAEKRVSEFYATMSHEMRTPLTSIRGSLGLMEGTMASSLPPKALRLVSIARSESDRLIRLINNILDLKKMDAGKLELELTGVEVSKLIDDTINAVAGMAHEHGVTIQRDVQEGESLLFVDHDRMLQVLVNLVSNAIKFSPREQAVVIRAGLSEGSTVRLSVVDEGVGIKPEDINKLFGKFQQLDSSDARPKGGTGLGLAIAKSIVEQHGGQIGVDSVFGQGTTFWVELPAHSVPLSMADDVSGRQRKYPNAKVLIAEDDHATREILKQQLSELPVQFLEAATGNETIAAVREHHPNLIILDVGIPDVDGFGVIDALKQVDADSTALLVYTSWDLSQEQMQRLRLTGDTRCLFKARTSEQQLLSTVRDMLKLAIKANVPNQ